MNHHNTRSADTRLSGVLKSILATFAGYAVGFMGTVAVAVLTSKSQEYIGVAILIAGWYIAVYTFSCWVVAVLPAWLFLQPDSKLWRPACSTLASAGVFCCLFAAIVVLQNLFQMRTNYAALALFLPLGVVIGGVTGFVSAILRRRGMRTSS